MKKQPFKKKDRLDEAAENLSGAYYETAGGTKKSEKLEKKDKDDDGDDKPDLFNTLLINPPL